MAKTAAYQLHEEIAAELQRGFKDNRQNFEKKTRQDQQHQWEGH